MGSLKFHTRTGVIFSVLIRRAYSWLEWCPRVLRVRNNDYSISFKAISSDGVMVFPQHLEIETACDFRACHSSLRNLAKCFHSQCVKSLQHLPVPTQTFLDIIMLAFAAISLLVLWICHHLYGIPKMTSAFIVGVVRIVEIIKIDRGCRWG